MRVPRIYLDAVLAEGATLPLSAERLNYLKNVLRLRDGQAVRVFDGQNHEADATLSLGKREASLAIGRVVMHSVESPLQIHLLQAMGKGEKMDWVIQKAVELGVTRITPVATERSIVDLKGERADKRHARFIDIAIGACEQSGRNKLPRINPILSLEDALAQTDAALKWVLHPNRGHAAKPFVASPENVAVLIGPEGGLSDHEIEVAIASGFMPLTLGPRVLRTETAPIVALSVLQMQWGDFSFECAD
ncbi:16S rRNA (uracil(1498)-N(3))-methyltransferase [Halothiobacillus sp.]|uniref:16S rRNA (uracil(1498)-N(3))-methyltransferase n=1 Tax=Halothiobacillus sp. TaxID=1891311 RepID=UPI002602367C|nr:16S rRNA (uracil(1498)-N(3))-methyltransferase [Halothiobacillus sp.]